MSFREYVEQGWVLCPIREGEKRPRGAGWNLRENGITDPVRADMLVGAGLCHAYSGTCAIDIDNVEMTRIWLRERLIDLDALMKAPDAVQIVRGDNTRGKLLYRLPEPLPTKQIKSDDKSQMWFELRCGATTGNTSQDVLPPTIHPSGQAYAWKYNSPAGDWRKLPLLPPELHELWLSMVRRIEPVISAQNAENPTRPANLNWLRELVYQRDADCTEPEWWEMGAIISHETGHSEEGYQLFDEWSATGASKYEGSEATRKKWDEIGSRPDQGGNAATAGKLLQERGAKDEDFGAPAGKQIDDVIAAAEAIAKSKHMSQFRWFSVGEMMDRPPTNWFVYSIFPETDDILFIAGVPGAGKSFLALSVSCAIARGVPWFGYDTEQGNVCYIAAEGFGTFTTRLQAYAKHYDLKPEDLDGFKLLGAGVNLTDTEQINALAESAKEFSPKLIVIDTLAATSGSVDHNSNEMQLVIDGAKLLRKHTGATVLIIAHVGKDDSKGIMGWQGVTANAETIAIAKKLDDGIHRDFRVQKQKNGLEGLPHLWKLVPIDLGKDAKGRAIVGAVAEFVGIAKGEDAAKVKRKRLNASPWHDSIEIELALVDPQGLDIDELRKRTKIRVPRPKHTTNPSSRFKEALATLIEEGVVVEPPLVGDGLYRLKDPGSIKGNPDYEAALKETNASFGPPVDSDADIL